MSYSKLILKDNPDIVWPLDDINESSSISFAINFFSKTASQYCAFINASDTTVIDLPIVFGGGTALCLTSSLNYGLSIPLMNRYSELYKTQSFSIEFWLRMDKVPAIELPVVKKRNNSNIGLFVKENYLIYRYGVTGNYVEIPYGLAELDQPTHIIMIYAGNSISLMVNGVKKSIEIDEDINNTDADTYFDFYGSSDYNVIVDAPAIYPYILSENVAKRHYIYGLGKSISESMFFNMGGDYYNFSTVSTRKSYYAYWDYPDEWQLIRYDNLIHTIDGITTNSYPEPLLNNGDSKVDTSSNEISFTSSVGATNGSYIDITNLPNIVGYGNSPFLAKIKFDGQPPSNGLSQSVMVIGNNSLNQFVSFELTNNSGSYFIKANNIPDSKSSSFYLGDITSSPTAYLGMKYDNEAVYYFALSGSAIQTASATSFSGSVYGSDNLSLYFPLKNDGVIRIGSNLNYDSSVTASTVSNIQQFYGTFLEFVVLPYTFSGSAYSQINGYASPLYNATFNTNLDRFKVKTFGNANFILNGPKIADITDDYDSQVISSNRIEFGYPDVISGSQVSIYATMYGYSSSVATYASTKLSKINNLEWLNLKNLSASYIKIDINILAEDANYYPPIIKYFKMETYPFSGSYVDIYDNGGDRIRIRNSASGHSFIPEFNETSSMFVTDTSGIKVYRNYVDVEFSPSQKPLQLLPMSDLRLWLDARYPLGLNKEKVADSLSSDWIDLSTNMKNAVGTYQPEYRIQSLNLLSNNIANGAESGTVTGLTGFNSTLSSNIEGAINGVSSIKIVPDGVSNDSYAETNASLFLSASQQYTIVGSITLNKIQDSSNLSSSARRIVVLTTGSDKFFTNQAPNEVGTHTVSATFTASYTPNKIRLYNGSSVNTDVVYWDNISLQTGSVAEWNFPLVDDNDRENFKFNGTDDVLESEISFGQPMTVYIAARGFGNADGFFGHSASAPALYSQSGSYRMFAGNEIVGGSVNSNFNIFVGVFNSTTSSLFINDSVYSGDIGTGSATNGIKIGFGKNQYLNGDVAGLLVFNTAHNASKVQSIKNWMKDAYSIE